MMTATSQQHQAELHKKLWDMANSLRGQMEASEFKNYILGLIFYRFLSEKIEDKMKEWLSQEPGKTYDSIWESSSEEDRADLKSQLVDSIGYFIQPQHLFSSFIAGIKAGSFEITTLIESINLLNASTLGSDTEESFNHLFDDLDLDSSKLGKSVTDRSRLIGRIIQHVNDIPFNHDDVEIDVLGDAYEFMISKFAATAGKSAGEFYTPQQVSTILAKIVAGDKKVLNSVYDPTCGSGSLLLRVSREVDEVKNYYGQELTSSTYNLARMNMMLHGVNPDDFDIKNDNTLTHPQHLDETFEAIVANPPYSAHWDSSALSSDDPRFSGYAKMAPKTKADFAFVQHMLHHLDDNGTMAVVLPHGVLFRGAAEGVIRTKIIKDNRLDAVIGLPANIFYGTSIPTCILVFKKCREDDDKVLFIDASQEFEKGKNSNSLRDQDVLKIAEAYESRADIDKFAKEVSLEDIASNGYNLNIPRYVDSSEQSEEINLGEIGDSLDRVEKSLSRVEEDIKNLFASLHEVKSTNVLEPAIRKIYQLIIENSPTIRSVIILYNKPSLNILLKDGEKVISLYDYYPIESHRMSETISEMLKNLSPTYSVRIKIERDGSWSDAIFNDSGDVLNTQISGKNGAENFNRMVKEQKGEVEVDLNSAWDKILEVSKDSSTSHRSVLGDFNA